MIEAAETPATEASTEKIMDSPIKEAVTERGTEVSDTELPIEKETEEVIEDPATEASTESITDPPVKEAVTEKETEAPKGKFEVLIQSKGGKVTIKDSKGQSYEVAYAQGAEPFRLEETAGAVIHFEIQSDIEYFEIGQYKITLNSGAVREEKNFEEGTESPIGSEPDTEAVSENKIEEAAEVLTEKFLRRNLRVRIIWHLQKSLQMNRKRRRRIRLYFRFPVMVSCR